MNIEDTCECEMFEFGDRVRSRINPNLAGVVIGERSWGLEYMVRLADGASTIWWNAIEIEHDPDFFEPKESKRPLPDNVVRVDFTKRRKLRKDTETEGVA